MERRRFEELVARAVESLPEDILDKMENVDVVVEDFPARYQLRRLRKGDTLLGLYEGVPLTERTANYGLVPPDKITIFQQTIEAICSSDTEIVEQIKETVQHEIAHHFGIDDERLEEFEREREERS